MVVPARGNTICQMTRFGCRHERLNRREEELALNSAE